MRTAALILLAACTLPDEVGVGTIASQFDYFARSTGDPTQWPFTNDTGYGYGVSLWATWKLGRPEDRNAWDWPERPPYYLAKGDSGPVIVTGGQQQEEPSHVEQLLQAGDRMSGWSPMLQFAGMLCIILIVGVAVRSRYLKHHPPQS